MRSTRWILSLALAFSLAAPALAEQLEMTSEPAATTDRPDRGMSMDKVEATYGAPARRVPAIGEPPITRWEYPGFVVYFEHNLVIHSVAVG
jgi:hypothetical protein